MIEVCIIMIKMILFSAIIIGGCPDHCEINDRGHCHLWNGSMIDCKRKGGHKTAKKRYE